MAIRFKQEKTSEMPAKKTGSPESNIIIFTSAKGGSGCSFLASSIASYMAQKTTLNVLLLDMNIGRMDSRIVFEINDPAIRDFGDLIIESKSVDTCVLKKIVVNFENSLHLLLPPLDIEKASILRNKKLDNFIEILRDHFDLVCIDIPGHLLTHIDIKKIDISDRFVFVSLPNIFSVNNNRILMDHIGNLRSSSDFYLVINKYNIKPAISPTGLSGILKYPVTSFIPYDRDIEVLVNTRGPGHIFRYNLRITRDISGLASKIYEELEL